MTTNMRLCGTGPFPQIIRATTSDVPSIQRLHRALCVEERDNGYSANQDVDGAASPEGTRYVEGRVGGDGLALVARSNEAVVGYLLAGFRTFQGEKAAGVESMFVPMEFRRRGIGSALMSAFLDWFRASDAPLASIAVAPGNVAAATLYRKAGFADCMLIDEGRTLILTIRQSGGEGCEKSSRR